MAQTRQKKKPTCIDLFCGCGGLSKGFELAGYKVLLGVDNDSQALVTFEKNHSDSKGFKLDLYNHENLKQIIEFLDKKKQKVDVIIGGPPCQGFSIAGPRDMNDKRNLLYLAMVKLVDQTRPQAVLLENVPGMLQTNGGIGAKRIISDFQKIGYNMVSKLLFAPDFGVPQIRKRVFFIGLKNGATEFEFPKPILSKDNYITCEEAIGDLPALIDIYGDEVQHYSSKPKTKYQKMIRSKSKEIRNHIGTIHDVKTKKMISLVPEGKNYKALPEKYRKLYKYHEALTRYHSKKPSLTINTGHRSHFHYKWNRIPTVRESARLQSFSDDFIFFGNKSQQYRQVGNAVPPILGKVVAEQLKKYLRSDNDE